MSRSCLSILHVVRKGRISPGFKQKSLFSRLRALQSCLKATCSLAKFSSAHWETSDAHNQSQESGDWLSVCGFRVLQLHLEHPLLVTLRSSYWWPKFFTCVANPLNFAWFCCKSIIPTWMYLHVCCNPGFRAACAWITNRSTEARYDAGAKRCWVGVQIYSV